jgi:hypothetical protein
LEDQNRKGVFLYFEVFLNVDEVLGPKKIEIEKVLNRAKQLFSSSKFLRCFQKGAIFLCIKLLSKLRAEKQFSDKN